MAAPYASAAPVRQERAVGAPFLDSRVIVVGDVEHAVAVAGDVADARAELAGTRAGRAELPGVDPAAAGHGRRRCHQRHERPTNSAPRAATSDACLSRAGPPAQPAAVCLVRVDVTSLGDRTGEPRATCASGARAGGSRLAGSFCKNRGIPATRSIPAGSAVSGERGKTADERVPMSDARKAPAVNAKQAPNVIETERLVGRRLTAADEPLFLTFHRDPRVVSWLGGGEEEITEAENREWLDEKLAHWERHGFGLYAWFAREPGAAPGRRARRTGAATGVRRAGRSSAGPASTRSIPTSARSWATPRPSSSCTRWPTTPGATATLPRSRGACSRWRRRPGPHRDHRRHGAPQRALAAGDGGPGLRLRARVLARRPHDGALPKGAMPKVVSAGLVMYRVRDEHLEVLLAHPGGPYYAHKDEAVWSIPKGEVIVGEDLLAAAKREFAEETGLRAVGPVPGARRGEVQKPQGRARLGLRGRLRPRHAGQQHLRARVAAPFRQSDRDPRDRPRRLVRSARGSPEDHRRAAPLSVRPRRHRRRRTL